MKMKPLGLLRPLSPATVTVKPTMQLPGSPIQNGRLRSLGVPLPSATASPASSSPKPITSVPGSSLMQIARQSAAEFRCPDASASPANRAVNPIAKLPGSPLRAAKMYVKSKIALQPARSPATIDLKPRGPVPGSHFQNGRQPSAVHLGSIATASPASQAMKPSLAMPGSSLFGRLRNTEARQSGATVEPGRGPLETRRRCAGLSFSKSVARK